MNPTIAKFMMLSYAFAAMYDNPTSKHSHVPDLQNLNKVETEPLLTFGNGKNKYDFETVYGKVEIFADNPKAAQKKLVTLNGINRKWIWKFQSENNESTD